MNKVFYYYYFLFYLKLIKADSPHLLTVLVLSLSWSLIVNSIIDFILIYLFKYPLGLFGNIGILALIICIQYFYFIRKNNAKRIVELKPKLFENHNLSIIITIIFFLFTASTLFWVPDLIFKMR